MTGRVLFWTAAGVLALGLGGPALARPQYLQTFKAHFNTAAGKPKLNAAMCVLCHVGQPRERMWNAFGQQVRAALAGGQNVQDRARIVQALETAAKAQAPNTNLTFGDLIARDTFPLAPNVAAPAVVLTQAQPRAGAPTAQPRWVSLFNGRDLTGWVRMNQGNWVVENGLLKYTGGGNGWLRSERQYTNYALVIEWRYPQPGPNDSGIFLKAGLAGNPWPGGPQLNMGPGDNFGSIGGAQGTRPRPDLIRRNDWNLYQVTVHSGAAALAINGQVAWEVATGLPTGPGYIGIQGEGRPLEIRQIWIMEF